MEICIGKLLDRCIMSINHLHGLAIETVGKLPDGGEIALFCLFRQFLRNPAKSKWIAPESNPKGVIERLLPVHTTDRPSHNALRISSNIDMSLLLIHRWNYVPRPQRSSSVFTAVALQGQAPRLLVSESMTSDRFVAMDPR
ncbi:hypothetical protein ABIE49_000655 [Bradyrhizobium sp. OAE829]